MPVAILRLFDRSAIVERDHAARILRDWRRTGHKVSRSRFAHGGPMRAYTLPNGARVDVPQRFAHDDPILGMTDSDLLAELAR
jgi:hypothetical protein